MMAVGINLDQHSISAVRIDGTAKNPVITQFAAEPMPAQITGQETDPYTFLAHILDDFLKRHQFPRENVFLAIASDYCIIRQFTVPFQSDDQIRKTIHFQAEAHIHAIPIENLELTYKKVGERKASSDVIVNAVRKDALRETINALRRVGIEPVGIDTPVFAAVNAVLNRAEVTVPEATLWIDIGVDHTTMVLTQGTEANEKSTVTPLKAVRLPKIGVNLPRDPAIETHIAQLMRKHHISTNGDANTAKSAAATPAAMPGGTGNEWPFGRDALYMAGNRGPFALPAFVNADGVTMTPEELAAELPMASLNRDTGKLDFGISRSTGGTLVLSKTTILEAPDILTRRLITEIMRTTVAFGAEVQIKRLRIAGGGEAAPMLVAAIRDAFPQFSVEALPADFGLKTKGDVPRLLSSRGQALIVPLGMALKGFGINHLGFEFRRGEFALEDAFEATKGPLMVCLFLLMLAFGGSLMFALKFKADTEKLERQVLDAAQTAFRQAYDLPLPDYTPPEPPETVEEIFDKVFVDVSAGIKATSTDGREVPVRSALDVWLRVQEAVASVGREPTEETRNTLSTHLSNKWPPRTAPDKPRDDHKNRLELEWTITRVHIVNAVGRDGQLEIRGRAIQVTGVEQLVRALMQQTDIFAEVKMDAFEEPTAAELQDARGQMRDTRARYRISAKILLPRATRQPSASAISANQ